MVAWASCSIDRSSLSLSPGASCDGRNLDRRLGPGDFLPANSKCTVHELLSFDAQEGWVPVASPAI